MEQNTLHGGEDTRLSLGVNLTLSSITLDGAVE
jgi:hypothetical protein